jgi:hypothetical protein
MVRSQASWGYFRMVLVWEDAEGPGILESARRKAFLRSFNVNLKGFLSLILLGPSLVVKSNPFPSSSK